jgi:flagellar basal-body rod protein FlgF
MDTGYYAACTAMMAQSESLELVANNLANSGTTGYRAQHSIFRSILATSSGMPINELNEATNNYGVLEGSRFDLSQGGFQNTGNQLDFAIDGPGFFAVQTENGKFFTRNGGFHVSHGQLVTSEGDPVLGEKGIIHIPNGPVAISPDGTISVDGAVSGKIELVEFAPGTQLESAGKTYYTAPAKSSTPSANSQIRQGVLETSNVDPVRSAVDLITVQRSFEMMQRALSLFVGQLNSTAVSELPRVTT